MKLTPIIAALALTCPFAANAQSLSDTHELVWHPTGKTPAATYRQRDKPVCVNRFDDHRAGRGQLQPKTRCATAAAKTATPPAAVAN